MAATNPLKEVATLRGLLSPQQLALRVPCSDFLAVLNKAVNTTLLLARQQADTRAELGKLALKVASKALTSPQPRYVLQDSTFVLQLPTNIPALPNVTTVVPFPVIPALNNSVTITGLPQFAWLNWSTTIPLPAMPWLNSSVQLSNAFTQPALVIRNGTTR